MKTVSDNRKRTVGVIAVLIGLALITLTAKAVLGGDGISEAAVAASNSPSSSTVPSEMLAAVSSTAAVEEAPALSSGSPPDDTASTTSTTTTVSSVNSVDASLASQVPAEEAPASPPLPPLPVDADGNPDFRIAVQDLPVLQLQVVIDFVDEDIETGDSAILRLTYAVVLQGTIASGPGGENISLTRQDWYVVLDVPPPVLWVQPAVEQLFDADPLKDPASFPAQRTEVAPDGSVFVGPEPWRDVVTVYKVSGSETSHIVAPPTMDVLRAAALSSGECLSKAKAELRSRVVEQVRKWYETKGFGPEIVVEKEYSDSDAADLAVPFEVPEGAMSALRAASNWFDVRVESVTCED